jgi:hypothetical protein
LCLLIYIGAEFDFSYEENDKAEEAIWP